MSLRAAFTLSIVFALLAASFAQAPPPERASAAERAWGAVDLSAFPEPSPAVTRIVEEIFDRIIGARTATEHNAAVRALVDIAPEAVPLLAVELERRRTRTRPAVVLALGSTGDPRVIPLLKGELESQQSRAYMDALYALSLAGDESALVRALRSSDANTEFGEKASAVDFIAGAKGPDAVPVLIREIPRRSERGRRAGLLALGTIGDDTAVEFLLEWSKRSKRVDRRFSLIALARIGDPRALPVLLDGLRDADPMVREAAVEGVGYLRTKEAVPRLSELAHDTASPGLQLRAIWSLALIGGKDASATLLSLTESEDTNLRTMLVKALGRLGSPHAAPWLARIGREGGGRALDAARSLVQIEGSESDDALLEVCSNAQSLEAGLVAALELSRRGDPRSVPCTVARIREEIDLRHRLGPTAEAILEVLPHYAQRSAADSLDVVAEGIAAPALAHRLRATARAIRLVGERGEDVTPWINLLEKGTPEEIELAIQRLGELGDPRAIVPLRRVFGRLEPQNTYLVPEALGKIDSDRATPFLISLITDDLYRVPSLAPMRAAAARALARCEGAEHVAKALRQAYLAEKGRRVVPLLALARVRGVDGIPELIELKRLLLRDRGPMQALSHERANWAIRLLRAGEEIPLEEIRDVR